MGTREDVIKQKLALQDSIRAEKDPRKKKALQKRFDKLRIPTHANVEKSRADTMKTNVNAVQAMKNRQAVLDSLRKAKN